MTIFLNKFTIFTQKYLWLMGFAICAYVLFSHLGDMALLSPDEGRNAEIAREMTMSNSWLAPTYNGLTYLDKPAFYFKIVALLFAWFGESEAVARLSSASFAFLLLIEVFYFCRKLYDLRTATLAILLIVTTPLYMAFARIVIFDMTLAFFVCSAIFACYMADETDGQARQRWYLLAAAAAATATLVKGPIGFILPTLVIGLFQFWLGRLWLMKQAFSPLNIALFLAIVLPWFIGVSWQYHDFPYYGIMKESVGRLVTTEFHRSARCYYYAVLIAATFFPWSLLLPEAIYSAWKHRLQLTKPDKLFIAWAVVTVLFFSLSKSKLPGYVLTVTVALGILCARLFAASIASASARFILIIRHSTVSLIIVCLLVSLLSAALWITPDLITRHLPLHKALRFTFFVPYYLHLCLSFLTIAVLGMVSLYLKNIRLIFACFMSPALLLMMFNFDMLTEFSKTRSARAIAARLPGDLPADTEFACLGCLPNGLPFYRKQLITVLTEKGKEFTSNYIEFSLLPGKPWPLSVVPLASATDWLGKQQHPVYLLANSSQFVRLESIANQRGLAVTALGSDYWATLLPKPD